MRLLNLSKTTDRGQRRGSVLLVVLVIVVLLSFGAYTFTEIALSELEATVMHGREVEARVMADSGVELAAALLGSRSPTGDNFYHNPEWFHGVVLRDAEADRGRGRFSLVAPVETDPAARMLRFGMIDESGKLNLNALARLGLDDDEIRHILLFLPGMTHEIADAILDWIDEDDQPRQFGAESEYYMTLSPPYAAKNGPLESLDELLLVRGVTPALLFGSDVNRNGLLDPDEEFGNATFHLGWSAYLTVHSRESNLRFDGRPRVNVNQQLLTDLYDELEMEFGAEIARFVVAYRMNGPLVEEEELLSPDAGGERSGGPRSSGGGGGQRGGGGGARGGSGGGQRGGGGGGASGGGDGGSGGSGEGGPSGRSASPANASSDEGAIGQAAQRLGDALFGGGGDGENITRGGLDLSQRGRNNITSLYDLVGAQVEAQVDGTTTVLESPWPNDASAMQGYLPELFDTLTTTDDEFIEGRININQTRREVLLGLPGMTEQLADAIVNSAMVGSGGEPLSDTVPSRATTGWLLMEGLVDLEQMRQLDRFLTTGGDVYRVQSLGYFDEGGPASRWEAVIDAAQYPPRVVFLRDLTELGRGYSRRQLRGEW